ncbi:MAG: hypothetical protein K0Q51_1474 [Rickettsiaceae bacterium]|jgi:hypothetical protein|nr:hypothetical protein [Rickettsiaceae bacterium]
MKKLNLASKYFRIRLGNRIIPFLYNASHWLILNSKVITDMHNLIVHLSDYM